MSADRVPSGGSVAVEPRDESGGGGPPSRKRRWLKLLARIGLGVTVLLVGAFFFLTRSSTGQGLVVDLLLDRVQGSVNGRIQVDGVSSTDLLEDIRVRGLRLMDETGEPLLEADSARATYSWRPLVTGSVVLESLVLFRPRLRIRREPGRDRTNAETFFGIGEEAPDTSSGVGAPVREVVFYDVSLVDGSVDVLLPVEGEPGPRDVVVPAPEGEGRFRKMAVEGLQADFARIVLAGARTEGIEATVDELALTGRVYREPFRLEGLQGLVQILNGRVGVAARDLRLAESRLRGSLSADFGTEGGPDFGIDVVASPLSLGDVRWIEPRLPEGTVEGGIGLTAGRGDVRWSFEDVTAVLEGGERVEARGEMTLRDGGFTFSSLEVEADPLALHRLEPWSGRELPLEGEVRGRLALDGTAGELAVDGEVTLQPAESGASATAADVEGVLDLEGELGATDLTAVLDPLDYGLLRHVMPGLELRGAGRARVGATGNLRAGVRFTADLVHEGAEGPPSRVLAQGSVRRTEDDHVVDVLADLGSFSLSGLRGAREKLPVSGRVSGTVRARGAISDLGVTTDLETTGGPLALEGRIDLREPGRTYRLEGEASDLVVSRLVPQLPDPTVVSGSLSLEGGGLDLQSARVRAAARLRASRVGGLHVDTLFADLRLEDGRIRVDTVDVTAGGVEVRGEGTLAVDEELPSGELVLAFRSDSLGGLRPVFLGDTVIARDTLRGLDREVLEVRGIDPDTLPLEEEVAMGGRVRGEVTLRGSLTDFAVNGSAAFEELLYGRSYVGRSDLTVRADGLPGLAGELRVEGEADSLRIEEWAFAGASLELDYRRPGGRAVVALRRNDREDYRGRAVFEVDSLGGRVELEELGLRFDTVRWRLQERAVVTWDDRAARVDGFVLTSPGEDPMRLAADGVLPREGSADFTLDVESLGLGRVAGLLQFGEAETAGRLDLGLRVRGTARNPVIEGSLEGEAVRYRGWSLDRIAGEFGYADRAVELEMEAWHDDLRVLRASGTVPADLALVDVPERIPDDRQIEVRALADSLPAAFALTMLEGLEQVEGTVAADFEIGGTLDDPSPTGTLVLQNAGWAVPALGVRHRDVQGTLVLSPDGTVSVEARARAAGTVRVTGTLDLEPLSDPGFDLTLGFQDFQAIERRDVTGRVGGEVRLTGTFRRPQVRGRASEGRGLRVERGVLFLEEFRRSSTVVDLSDPRLFALDDTAFLAQDEPLSGPSRNPFLQNLRVEVDLGVERDTWLRSEDLNVEMGGELTVVYDRGSRDLVLVGALEAVRGSYSVLGRRFEVQGGEVTFAGTPGINPNLNIEASTRVRRTRGEGEPLDIQAAVTGTLSEPRVELSSDEQAIASSDLVSYLIFGRPSYELASGQAALLEGAPGLLGTTTAAGLSVLSGTLTNRLGALVAQEWGLDYFAISQPGTLGLAGGGTGEGSFAQTAIEVGYYLTQDLFGVLVVRPLSRVGGATSTPVGVRLEWQATDVYRVEAFLDDRFLRSGAFGFQELGFRTSVVGGFLVFREWGY